MLNEDGGRAITGKSLKQLKVGHMNRHWVGNFADTRQWTTKCNKMPNMTLFWTKVGTDQ